jgi:carboxypeptidase Taq
MQAQEAYQELIRRCREEALLASCVELLGWDELTYLPRGGVEHRGNQLAYLAGVQHQMATDPRVGEMLDAVAGADELADPLSAAAVNVREIRRVYERQVRLPRSLVEESARVTTVAQQAWAEARERNDFARFLPWLERLLVLARRGAEALGQGPADYDVFLDEYEPGARTADVARLLAELAQELAPLLDAVRGARRRSDPGLVRRDYPTDRQRIFIETVADAIGFDFHNGRLDTTAHPFFSAVGPGDCRITTRYDPQDFGAGFYATLHEVGHGLYEQGLDPEHYGTPLGQAPSVGMHESQARLWENFVGRSRAFWRHFLPQARRVFHETLHGARLDEFYRAVNHVEPSLNRVRADELTYNLHILVRFELEQALLSGALPAADLPAAWAAAYASHLGVTPRTDAEGCLQDGHWAGGMFGYFPTYTLGTLIAAQLVTRAEAEHGDFDAEFARGDYAGLLGWLRDKVYRVGGRRPAPALIEHVTGVPLDHRPLVAYLRRKYGELYGL